VIAVGADDTVGTQGASDDTVPSFSNVGDGVRNPDLVAPGVHVQSLRVPGSIGSDRDDEARRPRQPRPQLDLISS